MNRIYDVVIIGKGPAGISASLYTARANLSTIIIGRTSSLAKSHKIDNYYGFNNGIAGHELLKQGEEQTIRFGTHILEDEVIALEYDFEGTYTIKTSNEYFQAKAVLLATGSEKNKLTIKNTEVFTGRGIHYCTTCDGYFYRNKKVAVLGFNEYALHEFDEMKQFSESLTLLTNGNVEVDGFNESTAINRKKITSFEGGEYLQKVVFDDGSEEEFDGIFIAYGTASSLDFARKLGILISDGIIEVNEDMKTGLEGLYAAGDCASKIKQIAVAVGQGAVAGFKISQYVRNFRR